MNPFFPVESKLFSVNSVSEVVQYLPKGGNLIRITVPVNTTRYFIKFGGPDMTVTGIEEMCEIVPGVIEEFDNPDPSIYSNFIAKTDVGFSAFAISCSPRYFQKKRKKGMS